MIAPLDSIGASIIMTGHIPVLAEETLELLAPRDGGVYMDGTFGGGGHTELILNAADCKVVAIDQDPQAEKRAEEIASRYGDRFEFRRMNFKELAQTEGETFDGFLFDFGVSSYQLDEVERGFSFRAEAPLDMRMNPEAGESAADWLAHANREDLVRAIRDYGEEKNWRRIVDNIINKRGNSDITTTSELAELVISCTPARIRFSSKIHPATRTFQGIRIAVNDELSVIETAIPAAFERLNVGGTLCAISFHSLEDRIVKKLYRHWAGRPEGRNDNRPQHLREIQGTFVGRRPTTAGEKEIAQNPRSRSAKLRALRKVK